MASKDDQIIYSPDCVPEGFKLSDPDHLNGFKIGALYMHWLQRQKKGLSPFIVLKGHPHHGESGRKARRADKKGKKKADWVDVHDDEMEVDEEFQSDGEEEMPQGLKVGPPMGKKKTIPDSTEDPSQVAGPSTLSPLPYSILPLPSKLPLPSTAPVSDTLPAPKPLPKPLPKKKKAKKTQADSEKKDERMSKGQPQM